jgi:hypothetical protein
MQSSLYVNDTFTLSRRPNVRSKQTTGLLATCLSLLLLAYSVEAYIGTLELWLGDRITTVKESKSNAVLFVKDVSGIKKPRTMQFLKILKEWVETVRYLGVTSDTQLTLSAHANQVKDSKNIGSAWPHS